MGFEQILAWKHEAEEQPPKRRVDCPTCGWSLTEHPDTGVLHCEFDGWTEV